MTEDKPISGLNAKLNLTENERLSGVWVKIDAHLRNRLQLLRERNDSMLSESDTAKLRGQIQELKDLLMIGNPKP